MRGKTLAVIFFSCAVLAETASSDLINPSTFDTYSHVEIKVEPNATYSLEKIEEKSKVTGLKITLKQDNVFDAKAPLLKAKDFSDNRTDEIVVEPQTNPAQGLVVFTVHFSSEAIKKGVEFFDYRSRADANIHLDYWVKKELPKLNFVETAKVPSKAKKEAKKATDRRLAGRAENLTPTGCGEPISVTQDGFLFWKPNHRLYAYREFFKLPFADEGYEYPAAKPVRGEDFGSRKNEILHYRLAFKLYKERKYALTLKAIGFFEEQYPHSILVPELEFLKGSTYVRLFKLLRAERYMKLALEVYRSLSIDAPLSDRARRSLAFLLQETIERNRPSLTLEYAILGMEQSKNADKKDLTPWIYRLASAEALYYIGEHDRAERAYQSIIDAQVPGLMHEAEFRLGEVYSARGFWERAVLAYTRAIRGAPVEAKHFPTAWFNLAESYFRLGRYREAQKAYEDYVQNFPTDETVWAGKIRLAELQQLQLKAPDPSKNNFIREMYEEIVNTYPFSPGSVLAELRLSACGHNVPFFASYFSRREQLWREKRFDSSLIDEEQVKTWLDLEESRFYLRNKEFTKALRFASKYRPVLERNPLGDSFKEVFSQALIHEVRALGEESEVDSDALLKLVHDFGDFAPKPEPFFYQMAIARAYAERTDLEKVAKFLGNLEQRLTEASVHEKDFFYWLKASHQQKLQSNPDLVIESLQKISDEGTLAFEKYDALSGVAISKKDYAASLQYDEKILETKIGKDIDLEDAIRVSVRRIETLYYIGRYADVAKLSDYVFFKYGSNTQFNKNFVRIRELKALALFDMKDWKHAALLLSEVTKELPKPELEFKLGKALAKVGKDEDAVKAFRSLAQAQVKESSDNVWKKSAQAELDQRQWENEVSSALKKNSKGQNIKQ